MFYFVFALFILIGIFSIVIGISLKSNNKSSRMYMISQSIIDFVWKHERYLMQSESDLSDNFIIGGLLAIVLSIAIICSMIF